MVTVYKKYSRISTSKFREILRLFLLDIDAMKISKTTKISRQSINRHLKYIRKIIVNYCESNSNLGAGEIEIDESYFGARRVKGKRGRGARGRTLVFGMLKRGDNVYTQIVKNCSATELLPIIEELADKESVFLQIVGGVIMGL